MDKQPTSAEKAHYDAIVEATAEIVGAFDAAASTGLVYAVLDKLAAKGIPAEQLTVGELLSALRETARVRANEASPGRQH